MTQVNFAHNGADAEKMAAKTIVITAISVVLWTAAILAVWSVVANVTGTLTPVVSSEDAKVPAQVALNVIQPRANQEPRIQVMANIFVQSPVNDIDATVKAQEHARQLLYETAGKECETLRATIAKECQLESINVNVTVQNYGPGRPPDGFMVNSTFVYRITPK